MPLHPWHTETQDLCVDTTLGSWTATVYEPFCQPRVEIWLQQVAHYRNAKRNYKEAKENYARAKHEATAETKKAEAEDQEANAKYRQACTNFGRAKKEYRRISKAEWEKAEADYGDAKREYDIVKQAVYKAKRRVEKAKTDAEADFEKAKAELEKAEVEHEEGDEDEVENGEHVVEDDDVPDRFMPALQIGVDIKLVFCPSYLSADTRSIQLIQFKRPIYQSRDLTSKGWAVDATGPDIYPYFGWDNEDKPRCHGNEHKAHMQRFPPRKKKGPGANKKSNQVKEDVDVRKLLGIRVRFPGQEVGSRFVRGLVPAFKGQPLTQEGSKSTKPFAAYIIDTPREMCCGPASALFATYAYDLSNGKWLGGVSWGYRLSHGIDGKLRLEVCGLRQRGSGAPLRSEEGETRKLWMAMDAPRGRVPVPPDEDVEDPAEGGRKRSTLIRDCRQ